MSQSEARAKRRLKKQLMKNTRTKMAKKFPYLTEARMDSLMRKYDEEMTRRVPEVWSQE